MSTLSIGIYGSDKIFTLEAKRLDKINLIFIFCSRLIRFSISSLEMSSALTHPIKSSMSIREMPSSSFLSIITTLWPATLELRLSFKALQNNYKIIKNNNLSDRFKMRSFYFFFNCCPINSRDFHH